MAASRFDGRSMSTRRAEWRRGGAACDDLLVATSHQNTLLHFRFNPSTKPSVDRHGEGSNRTGHEGKSIDVETPVGTVVYDAEAGEKLHDFTEPGERFLVARGGRGGTRQTRASPPRHTRRPRNMSPDILAKSGGCGWN